MLPTIKNAKSYDSKILKIFEKSKDGKAWYIFFMPFVTIHDTLPNLIFLEIP